MNHSKTELFGRHFVKKNSDFEWFSLDHLDIKKKLFILIKRSRLICHSKSGRHSKSGHGRPFEIRTRPDFGSPLQSLCNLEIKIRIKKTFYEKYVCMQQVGHPSLRSCHNTIALPITLGGVHKLCNKIRGFSSVRAYRSALEGREGGLKILNTVGILRALASE